MIIDIVLGTLTMLVGVGILIACLGLIWLGMFDMDREVAGRIIRYRRVRFLTLPVIFIALLSIVVNGASVLGNMAIGRYGTVFGLLASLSLLVYLVSYGSAMRIELSDKESS